MKYAVENVVNKSLIDTLINALGVGNNLYALDTENNPSNSKHIKGIRLAERRVCHVGWRGIGHKYYSVEEGKERVKEDSTERDRHDRE